ncbi:MAG: hypothetical protein HRU20_16820 [Pseudomonadales bacterium]|nr:hypothetical protein [Pseudomonadales bacterium]
MTTLLDDKRWRNNRLRSNEKKQLLITGITSLSCLLLGGYLCLRFVPAIIQGNEPLIMLLVLSIPFVGVLVLRDFLTRLKAWQQYGVIELQLDPFPGAIGAHIGGHFSLSKALPINVEYTVSLSCNYSAITGNGDSRRRSESVKWHIRGLAKPQPLATNQTHCDRLSFAFDIPYHLPPTQSHLKQQTYHLWRCYLQADLPKNTLKRDYEIPVIISDKRSSVTFNSHRAGKINDALQEHAMAKKVAAGKLEDTSLGKHIQVKREGLLFTLHHGMFRHRLAAFFALIFAIVPAFFAWHFSSMSANGSLDWMDIVLNGFALLPAGISIMSLVAFIALFLNSLTVRFDQNGVHSMRKIIGIPVAKRYACYDEIQYLNVERNGSTGTGHNKIEHFHITAITKKKDFPVATSIDGKAAAEILKEHLETLIISRLP